MKNTMIALSAALIPLAIIAACGSSETLNMGSGAGGPTSGATGGAGGLGGGGSSGTDVTVRCQPACEAGQICSVTGACIPAGTCADDGDCGVAKVCDPDTTQCVPGSPCGAMEIKADAVPPNLLIVLDRSCSMTDRVAGIKKWDIAVGAIKAMATDFSGQIHFGLSLFPDLVAPSCQQDAIPIPPGGGNEAQIVNLLTASMSPNDPYYPKDPCVTNIDTAMTQAAASPQLADATRDSYALLITDGKQSACNLAGGDVGTTQTITSMQGAGVSTFVVGFGAGIDPAQMNAFAAAGGVSASGASAYYQADDQASLDAALSAIATKTLSCSFALEQEPEDPEKVYVFFNNSESVPRDPSHTTGWDYDPQTNQITFYGATCEELKGGTLADVDIVFGCDAPTPD